jgi:hypothetical protein
MPQKCFRLGSIGILDGNPQRGSAVHLMAGNGEGFEHCRQQLLGEDARVGGMA